VLTSLAPFEVLVALALLGVLTAQELLEVFPPDAAVLASLVQYEVLAALVQLKVLIAQALLEVCCSGTVRRAHCAYRSCRGDWAAPSVTASPSRLNGHTRSFCGTALAALVARGQAIAVCWRRS
jgi:hypothetical protein